MKSAVVLTLSLGLVVLALACGGGSSPSQPSSGSTNTTATFTVPLSAANENPPVTNADASITGTGTIKITATKDSGGNITAATANFQIDGRGFPAGTTVNMAHIHSGGPSSNGAIVVNVGLASGDLAVNNGSGSATKNGVNVPTDVAAAILKDPGNYYFNVHTLLNPNGAVRGQLAGGGSTYDPGTPTPAY